MAFASSASSLSNTGAPRPRGTPRQTQVTTPPQESPRVRTASMAAIMRSAVLGWGHLTMLASTSSRVNASRSMSSSRRSTSRTLLTNARISMPATWASTFLAMAPAATRPMVSRALERPPPCVFWWVSGAAANDSMQPSNAPQWPARRTSCHTWHPRGWVGRPPGGGGTRSVGSYTAGGRGETRTHRHFAVVPTPLVLVAYQHRDGRPKRLAVRRQACTPARQSSQCTCWCAGWLPHHAPDRISHVSSSLRGVVMRLCPGRRRSSSN